MTETAELMHLPRPTAFVFGGGAASTASQVGMVAAVLDAGIRPDLIVGTSAGALNGVVLADDPHGAVERLKKLWSSFDRSWIIRDSRLRQLRNLLGGHFMFRNSRLKELFAEQVAARSFDALHTRFACVATDLSSGEPVTIQTGQLLEALLATCAIPGVFPLVRRDGRLLADGGYVANAPIRQAIDLGAASIIVFDGRPRIQSRSEPNHVRDSMTAAFAATLKRQYESDIDYARDVIPVLSIPGQPTRHVKGFDFANAGVMIRNAEATARAYLATPPRALPATSRADGNRAIP